MNYGDSVITPRRFLGSRTPSAGRDREIGLADAGDLDGLAPRAHVDQGLGHDIGAPHGKRLVVGCRSDVSVWPTTAMRD